MADEFSLEEFYLDLNDVTMGPAVGGGAFSQVFKALYFGDVVAVKKQKRNEEAIEQYLLRELAILSETDHPNLLNYIGAYNDGKAYVYVVTEFAPGGDVLGLLDRDDVPRPLSWALKARIARDAAAGLAALHAQGIVHRDVKSANLLLDAEYRTKVADFGFARHKAQNTRVMSVCGTDEYMAPELLFDEEYDERADVFSFGIVLWELAAEKKSGQDGFLARSPASRFQLDWDEINPQAPADAPFSFLELARQCCSYEADERPSMQDALEWLDALLEDLDGDVGALPPLPESPPVVAEAEAAGAAAAAEPPPAPQTAQTVQTVVQPTTALARPASQRDVCMRRVEEDGSQQGATVLLQHSAPLSGEETQSSTTEAELMFRRCGWLHKRAGKGALRNWKRRWCELDGFSFSWRARPEDEQPLGGVDLRTCVFRRESVGFRFRIAAADDGGGGGGEHSRQFAAKTGAALEQWADVFDALAAADTCATCKELLRAPGRFCSEVCAKYSAAVQKSGLEVSAEGTEMVRAREGSVAAWLAKVRLGQYADAFASAGFAEVSPECVTDEALDRVGVEVPLHRRVLSRTVGL